MNTWLPYLGVPLAHGPIVAFLAAFAISPGIPALIALVLERRVLRHRQEFVAFLYGDALLALATACGVALCRSEPPAAAEWFVTGWFARAVTVGWLAFGLWQWRAEAQAGKYSHAQALSPTKIWHQLATYPLLGYLAGAAILAGLTTPTGSGGLAAKALMTGCVLAWVVANIYDSRHPKLGHLPYDWHRLRPHPTPWAVTSSTLSTAASSGLEPLTADHVPLTDSPE